MTRHTDLSDERIALPLPPASISDAETEIDVYARFMRHLRHVPNNRIEIKILSAIQFTADMTDHSDAHVAKILVDFGLRAPRMAFPADFLRFADHSLLRSAFQVGGPSKSLLELQDHWHEVGEDRFAAFRGEYSIAGHAGHFEAV